MKGLVVVDGTADKGRRRRGEVDRLNNWDGEGAVNRVGTIAQGKRRSIS